MDKLKNYDVSFVGLKNGLHQYDFEIDKEFFDLFEFDEEFDNPKLKVHLDFEKKETMLLFDFKMKGDVSLTCDLTSNLFEYPLNNNFQMVVRFGEDFIDEGEDIIIIPHSEHTINVAHWIYESFMLSLPLKRIHPKVINGELKTKEMDQLEALQPQENQIEERFDKSDPRWDKLKNLLTDK